jgi:Tol biopolymer transport system component
LPSYNGTMDATNPTFRARRSAAGLLAGLVGLPLLAAIAPATPAAAAVIPATPYLVSRDASGAVLDGVASEPAVDGSGRFVAFATNTSLDPADKDQLSDVYLRDRWAGTTELISVSTAGVTGNATSGEPSISDDGRFVAFRSAATNWDGPPTNGRWNVWVRDRVKGTTVRASLGQGAASLGADAERPSISGNGRFVVYSSNASNVVPNDTNAKMDVFVRDLVSGTNDRVSISLVEGQSAENSFSPSISDDGNRIAFISQEELASGRPGHDADVFVRDRSAGSTVNANFDSASNLGNADPSEPIISGNGRFVAFSSLATNLVAGDTNAKRDVFRRDLQTNTTIRVSLHDNDQQLTGESNRPALSDDGDLLAFTTSASATSERPDGGADQDVYLRGVSAGTTRRISASAAAGDPDGTHTDGRLSDDGQTVAFRSFVPSAPALVAEQPAGTQHVYASAPLSFGPLGSATAFIDQQHQDFLGRSATTAERTTWSQRFATGRAHPAQLVAELARSEAFAGKRAPVVRLYWAFFLRKPDPGGLNHWISRYQSGASLASIAQKFAQSSEFKNRYGTLSNSAYVTKVYLNVFGREPDASGRSYWTGKLDRKEISRGQVLVNFSESSEGKRRLAPQVHLLLIPLGMLRTVPSNAFFDAGLAAFVAGERQAAYVAQQVIVGAAYDARL